MPTLVAVAPVGMGTHSGDRVTQCLQPRFSSGHQSPFTVCQCHPTPPLPKSPQMGGMAPPPLGHPIPCHTQAAGRQGQLLTRVWGWAVVWGGRGVAGEHVG